MPELFSIDLQKIAENLIVAVIGGWVFWVSKGIVQNSKDLDHAFQKIRRNENGESSSTENSLSSTLAAGDKKNVRDDGK